MFGPVRETMKHPISYAKYEVVWLDYIKSKRLWPDLRWGQHLCNKLGIDPPGLFYCAGVREANLIFNEHFKLE
jgi:hypothetical protein